MPKVKVTYASRSSRPSYSSSSPSTLSSSSPPAPTQRKRPFEDRINKVFPPAKKRVKEKLSCKPKQKALTQLHFAIDTTVLRTCSLCLLSYIKGAPDDESLHRAHCARVQRGMEWGKEEEREKIKAGVTEVGNEFRLKDGKKGRIVCFRADVGGKLGGKVCDPSIHA
jgi:N-acetyltransferase